MDHHHPQEPTDPEVLNIATEFFGLSGDMDIAASTAACFFALELDDRRSFTIRDSDRQMAQLACDMEDEMDRMYWKARKKLPKYLEKGRIAREADDIYLELLRSLERISDHADGLAISVVRG